MVFPIQNVLYFITLIAVTAYGIFRFNKLSSSVRIIVVLTGIALISELIASYSVIKYRTNTAVYHLYNMVELGLIGLYFDRVLQFPRKNVLAICIAALSCVGFAVNAYYFQHLSALNSNFLLFEGFCTITLCLITLRRMFLSNKETSFRTNPDFWMCLLFMLYWCSTYVSWAFWEIVIMKNMKIIFIMQNMFWLINMITYVGIGLVFMINKPKTAPHE